MQNPYPIGLCENCQALIRSENGMVAEPPCKVCGSPHLRVVDAREPRGFFTDLEPGDFEVQFEWTPRSTRLSLSIRGTGSTGDRDNPAGNTLTTAVKDHVISLNDNGGKGGFAFRAARVYGEPRVFAVAPGAEAEDGATQTGTSVTTYGPTHTIALLDSRFTDVLIMGEDRAVASWHRRDPRPPRAVPLGTRSRSGYGLPPRRTSMSMPLSSRLASVRFHETDGQG